MGNIGSYHYDIEEDPYVYYAACILCSMATNTYDELPNPTGRFIDQSHQIDADDVVEQQFPPDDDEPIEAEGGGAREGGPPPPVPAIAEMIGACSPPFEKRLTKSDVSEGLGRLTLFKEFVNLHLAPMFNADEDLVGGIGVTVFDAQGRRYNMRFKLWASKLYVLTSGWTEFFQANNLTEPGLDITLWMFRHVDTHNLCFAIIPRMAAGP